MADQPHLRVQPLEAAVGELETGEWIDIGGLKYGAAPVEVGPSAICSQSAYASADPNLTPDRPTSMKGDIGGFRDLAGDQPASPANTFSYTLNLTQCLASRGATFNPGEERGFGFTAYTPQANAGDQTGVTIFFERQ